MHEGFGFGLVRREVAAPSLRYVYEWCPLWASTREKILRLCRVGALQRFCSSTDAQTARQLMGFTSVVTQVCCFGAGGWEKLKTSDNLGENPVITGRNAALFVEEMVFICLKNLGYTFVHLTQIWSLEGGHRMGENQF